MQLYLVIVTVLVSVVRAQINIREINELILTDLVNSARKSGSHEDYLKSLIDVVTENDRSHPHDGVVNEFITSCGTPLNKTACRDALDSLCADIPVLLRHMVDQSSGIINITDLYPLLVYHEASLTCRHHMKERKHGRTVPTKGQAWGYGIGFVALICTIANIGAFMGPFMSKHYFERILLFVVALAVGTLAGTGMLVLIPESMHLTEEDSPIPDYHLKMTTVLCGVYFFYVSERIMKMCFSRNKRKQHGTNGKLNKETEVTATGEAEQLNSNEVENHGHSHFLDCVKNSVNGIDGDTQSRKEDEVSTVAWMVLAGDVLHNFVDGIAIGAAFTENVYLGVSVSIAIICEELPHELGDIAILLNAGLSMKRALCYNFLAAVVCFLGLALGIVVGENSDANVWIFAVAGGMFVYIALVDMLPEMASQYNRVVNHGTESPGVAFCIQNLGLIIGFLIIFFLAFYGGNIQV